MYTPLPEAANLLVNRNETGHSQCDIRVEWCAWEHTALIVGFLDAILLISCSLVLCVVMAVQTKAFWKERKMKRPENLKMVEDVLCMFDPVFLDLLRQRCPGIIKGLGQHRSMLLDEGSTDELASDDPIMDRSEDVDNEDLQGIFSQFVAQCMDESIVQRLRPRFGPYFRVHGSKSSRLRLERIYRNKILNNPHDLKKELHEAKAAQTVLASLETAGTSMEERRSRSMSRVSVQTESTVSSPESVSRTGSIGAVLSRISSVLRRGSASSEPKTDMRRGKAASVNQHRLSLLFNAILDDDIRAASQAQQEAIYQHFNTDKELTFDDFWEMITSPNNEHPEFQANLQFALVEHDIRDCAAYAFKEIFLWVHRMDYYRESWVGRAFVLGSDQVTPRRSTLAALKTLRVLDSHRASDSAVFTEDQPLYAVAVWLDNVAAKDEYQYVMGVLSVLSGLRKYLDGEDDLDVPGRKADEAAAAAELSKKPLPLPSSFSEERKSSEWPTASHDPCVQGSKWFKLKNAVKLVDQIKHAHKVQRKGSDHGLDDVEMADLMPAPIPKRKALMEGGGISPPAHSDSGEFNDDLHLPLTLVTSPLALALQEGEMAAVKEEDDMAEQVTRISQLHDEGRSVSYIAKQVGRKQSAVFSVLAGLQKHEREEQADVGEDCSVMDVDNAPGQYPPVLDDNPMAAEASSEPSSEVSASNSNLSGRPPGDLADDLIALPNPTVAAHVANSSDAGGGIRNVNRAANMSRDRYLKSFRALD